MLELQKVYVKKLDILEPDEVYLKKTWCFTT